jgi:hypothetical protein
MDRRVINDDEMEASGTGASSLETEEEYHLTYTHNEGIQSRNQAEST